MHKDSFLSQMQERSHEELYEIAHFGSEDDFVPEAVQAAKEELAARSLGTDQVAQIAETLETRRKQKKALADKPLSWPGRVAFFVLPVGLLPIIILVIVASSLESRGYMRKSSEAYRWMGVGFTFWLLCGLVLGVLNFVFSRA